MGRNERARWTGLQVGVAACRRLGMNGWLALTIQLIALFSPGYVWATSPWIATKTTHSCAVTGGGGVKCWGENSNGQLGDNSTLDRAYAVDVVGLSGGVVAVTVGSRHSCALTSAGGVKCWGHNYGGRNGNGLGTFTDTDQLTPGDVIGLTSGVRAISAGAGHTCALTSAGAVKCWGASYLDGANGDGTDASRSTPVDVVGLASGVVAISAGGNLQSGDHTCAMKSTGGVVCWGYNRSGQLGDGSTTTRMTPVDVAGLGSGVTAIAAGDYHVCAVTASGNVKCWGDNTSGALGNNSTARWLVPTDVQGLNAVAVDVTAGSGHTCALTTAGGVKCWGGNGGGQLGDQSLVTRLTPVDVVGLTQGVTGIAAGGNTCALTDRAVRCWGSNQFNGLGDGSVDGTWLAPVDVSGLTSGVQALATGNSHACALTAAGGVKCWGWNNWGQLGDGSVTQRYTPVDVVGLTSGVKMIAAGKEHSCALTTAGAVKCWGNGYYGQLGNGEAGNPDGYGTYSLIPVDVIGLGSGVTAISASGDHACAITSAGALTCWGDNLFGELADAAQKQALPGVVGGQASGVVAVSTGSGHTCVVTVSSTVSCWGMNLNGQVGLDPTLSLQSLVPVTVGGPAGGSVEVVVGGMALVLNNAPTSYAHTCARSRSGAMACWGLNYYGQLGDSTLNDHWVPAGVQGLSAGVTAMAAGNYHTCALTSGGAVKCWGRNGNGQLGDGSKDDRKNPVDVVGLSSGVKAIAASTIQTCALTIVGGVKCWGDGSRGQSGDGTARFRALASLPVAGFADAVTLSTSQNPAAAGQSLVYTATLASASPTGSVKFNFGDGSALETATLASGKASITHRFASSGSYTVSASYSGDSSNATGSGRILQQVVSSSLPEIPSNVSVVGGGGMASVSFTAPVSQGGAMVSAYAVSCTAGASTVTATGVSSPVTVEGLINGTPYACTVKAANSFGSSAASASVSVTPQACSFALSTYSLAMPASAGYASVNVTTGAGCKWWVDSYSASWVYGPSVGSTTGSGSFSVTLDANTGAAARSATVTVAGKTLVITQAVLAVPICTLTASPPVTSGGSPSTLTASCSPAATSYSWTATGFATTASSGIVSPAKTTLYSVVGSNSVGSGLSARAAVYVCNTQPSIADIGTTVNGSNGDDFIRSQVFSEIINAGKGIDTIIYQCNRSSFTISKNAAGWNVNSVAEGQDILVDVERLQFADRTVALDISGNAGQAYRVYQAAFNRVPDNGGLKYWIAQMDAGMSQVEVAARFVDSAEFRSLYGTNPTNADFLTRLYTNVLHRTPDPAGYAWWLGELDAGRHNKVTALAGFSESPENQAGVLNAIMNGIDLLN